ncbi:MAG: transcriptional regulator [Dehalococcoidia bacterium]
MTPAEKPPNFAPAEIDRLIHEPARLSIMTNLAVVESANATWLLQQTGLTWGNLGSHLTKLADAGYISVTKRFKRKQPETTLALTAEGRDALLRYREQLLAALTPVNSEAQRDRERS